MSCRICRELDPHFLLLSADCPDCKGLHKSSRSAPAQFHNQHLQVKGLHNDSYSSTLKAEAYEDRLAQDMHDHGHHLFSLIVQQFLQPDSRQLW